MFNCPTCTRRLIGALSPEGTYFGISPRSSVPSCTTRSAFPRPKSRNFSHAIQRGSENPVTPKQAPTSFERSHYAQSQYAQARNRRLNARIRTNGSTELPRIELKEAAIKKELQWMSHPAKLADYVLSQLQKPGGEEKALALARYASRTMSCTVSWNHIIDFQMKAGHPAKAMSAFNEMKKRGQIPDSYTFSLLLRGFADNAHLSQSLSRAMTVFNSMFAPNSKVKPSILHTNAVIKVCARANDLDALLGVASRLPETGAGAANQVTFNTILTALRESALLDSAEQDEVVVEQAFDKAIENGLRIWEDIVGKWTNGDLVLDERLVCSMGHLLLLGRRSRDWDYIYSLLQQTMNIPRLGVSNSPTPAHEHQVWSPPKRALFVRPGPNTLSLVLHAALKSGSKRAALEYWNLLTDSQGYSVKPDLDNYNMLLRILRQARSSGAVVELVSAMVDQEGIEVSPKTFRIAMAACARDSRNHRVMENAWKLLGLMNRAEGEPNLVALGIYMDLMLAQTDSKVVLKGMEHLQPAIIKVMDFVHRSPSIEGLGATPAQADMALKLIRKAVGRYDWVLQQGGLTAEEAEAVQMLKGHLARFLGDHMQGPTGRTVRGVMAEKHFKSKPRRLTQELRLRDSHDPSLQPAGR